MNILTTMVLCCAVAGIVSAGCTTARRSAEKAGEGLVPPARFTVVEFCLARENPGDAALKLVKLASAPLDNEPFALAAGDIDAWIQQAQTAGDVYLLGYASVGVGGAKSRWVSTFAEPPVRRGDQELWFVRSVWEINVQPLPDVPGAVSFELAETGRQYAKPSYAGLISDQSRGSFHRPVCIREQLGHRLDVGCSSSSPGVGPGYSFTVVEPGLLEARLYETPESRRASQ